MFGQRSCNRHHLSGVLLRGRLTMLVLGIGVVLSGGVAAHANLFSTKKGMCLSLGNYGDVWGDRARALNVSWGYTWGYQNPDDVPANVSFVPMIWGAGKNMASHLQTVTDQLQQHPGIYPLLLGFNEPNNANQSDISVEDALDAWPQLEATGLPLGSPASTNAENQWMRDFMRGANQRGYRVDYVTMHWYGGANATTFLKKVKNVHDDYGLPVIITEFAVKGDVTWQQVDNFMNTVLPVLESRSYVKGYAWYSDPFSSDLRKSALFKQNGEITNLGRIYAAFDNPVPEPGTLALFAFASLLIGRRTRSGRHDCQGRVISVS